MENGYDISGLGPNSNSSYGDYQNLTTSDLLVNYDATIKGTLETTDIDVGTFSGNDFTSSFTLTDLEARVTALEGSSFDSSIVDNLSTTVQALQTRTGTLESLIGLLTNDNTNDTAIEHRLSRLEKTITALKAIHDAKKSVYSIPLDW